MRDVLRSVSDFVKSESVTKQMTADLMKQMEPRDYLRDMGVAPPIFAKRIGYDASLVPMAADVVRSANDLAFFNPPVKGQEPEKDILFRYRHLNRLIDDARFLSHVSGFKQYEPFYDALRFKRGEFLMPFSPDPGKDFAALNAQFEAGKIPAYRPDYKPQPATKDLNLTQRLDERIQQFSDIWLKGARDAKAARLAAEELKQQSADAGKAFVGLAGGAAFAAKELAAVKAPERPEVYASIPPQVHEVAKRAKAQFGDPLKKFQEEYSSLNAALFGEMIDVGEYQRYRDDLLKRTEESLHLDNKPHLADAALVGSQEDARLLSHFFAGQQQVTTEERLTRILEVLTGIRDRIRDIKQPVPVQVGVPGGS